MATHSSVLAWRIPGTGELGGLPSMESHRVGHNWSDLAAAALVYDCKWNIKEKEEMGLGLMGLSNWEDLTATGKNLSFLLSFVPPFLPLFLLSFLPLPSLLFYSPASFPYLFFLSFLSPPFLSLFLSKEKIEMHWFLNNCIYSSNFYPPHLFISASVFPNSVYSNILSLK